MTPKIDPVDAEPSSALPGRSRRAILAGALGGLGAFVAAGLGRAAPTRAANGDPMLVAGSHTGTGTTSITTSGSIGFHGVSSNSTGAGLRGTASSMTGGTTGVYGDSGSTSGFGMTGKATSTTGNTIGVYGECSSGAGIGVDGENVAMTGNSVGVQGWALSPTGVGVRGWGYNNSTGVLGYSGVTHVTSVPEAQSQANTAIYGYAAQPSSRGVWGRTTVGQAVRGQATSGVGLFGTSATGYALRTDGRLRADKVSGVATIPAGSDRVTVSPGVNVTTSSFVLLTPRANLAGRDLWFTTNATNNTLTIRMSAPRGSGTKVAWLLIG